MLQQAYGEDCMSRTQCIQQINDSIILKAGRTSTNEDPRPGRPATSTNDNIDTVHGTIRKDCCLTVQNVEEVGISIRSCHTRGLSCRITTMTKHQLMHHFLSEIFWKNSITILPHPLYSPHLAPADVFLVSRVTGNLERM